MLRFTIHDMLWLTVVVALGVALYLSQSQLDVSRRQLLGLVNALQKLGVEVNVSEDYVLVRGSGLGKFESFVTLTKYDQPITMIGDASPGPPPGPQPQSVTDRQNQTASPDEN